MSSLRNATNKNTFALDEVLERLPQNNVIKHKHKNKYRSTTGGDQTKLSSNYIEVKKNKLSEVPVGTYMRYFDSNGNLKPGGGKFKSIGQNAEGESVVTLNNFNSSTKKYYMWTVKFADISKIYRYVKDGESVETTPARPEEHKETIKKPETEEEQIISQIGNKMLFNDNELLKQKVDSLELEIQRIDTDLKKIFLLVKRVYTKAFQSS